MFSNFTEETCTGTGDTLALTGATTGKIPFSKSYADGDLVAYALEDSGGIIKVSGVGTYVSATDDITRNDTWNWNGTVIDNNPSTNIALSGGTHTVRCDVVSNDMLGLPRASLSGSNDYLRDPFNMSHTTKVITSDTIFLTGIFIAEKVTVTKIGVFQIGTANGTKLRVGIYSTLKNGRPDKLLSESSDIDCSTTGYNKTSTVTKVLQRGLYVIGVVSDGTPTISASDVNKGIYPYLGTGSGSANVIALKYVETTGWSSMPLDLSSATFTAETYSTPLGLIGIA